MASGTIRITNIPVSAGGYDYTLGATATWSTTRSGNTVTVSGKVTTDAQGSYSFNSTYAINCTLVWGGDVKKNIAIKAADSGTSIFSRAGSYEQTFFNVPASQTSFNMQVIINHTNNNSSGSGSGTITFPIGWTNISYAKKPVPVITTYPWRGSASQVQWYIYKATDGTGNAVSKYTTYYNRYQKSTSKWLGWTKQNEFAASVFSSHTYATVNYGGTLNAGDGVRLKVIATGKMGDTAEVIEAAAWGTDVASQGFQTGNTVPNAPTFNTSSPLVVGSTVNVKISAKDGSTSFYNGGKSHLLFSITTSSGQLNWVASSSDTYTNTFTYTKNVATLLSNSIGDTITLYGGVGDGFANAINSKSYQYGKVLKPGTLTFPNTTTIPYDDNTTITVRIARPSVDVTGSYLSTKSTTVKLWISYSSSSGFKELKSGTLVKNTAHIDFSSGVTRKAIFTLLGNPSSTSSKVYFKASYTVNGFDTVYTSVNNLGISFIIPVLPTMAWSSSLPYYRWNNGSPVGKCVANSVSIANLSTTNFKYNFTIDTNTKTVTSGDSYTFQVGDLAAKTYNVKYSIYDKSTNVLVCTGTIADSSFLRADPISAGLTQSFTLNDSKFLESSTVNQITGVYTFNVGNQAYQVIIKFYLNDSTTPFYTENLGIFTKNSMATSYPVAIRVTNSSNGYMPSTGYKISQITFNNTSHNISGGPIINVNENNTIKVTISVVERFSMNKTTTFADFNQPNSNFNTVLTKTNSVIATATAMPVTTGKVVELHLKS